MGQKRHIHSLQANTNASYMGDNNEMVILSRPFEYNHTLVDENIQFHIFTSFC